MKTLIDCIAYGIQSVILIDDNIRDGDVLLVKEVSSYELFCKSIELKIPILLYIEKYTNVIKIKYNAIKIDSYNIPARPFDDRSVSVSSFGRTHNVLNGIRSENNNLDWFFKGNGSSLKTTGERIILPMQSVSGGIEIEYALVVIITPDCRPKIVGYTISDDFSDVGLRRRHPNLANLSKLMPTGIGHQLILIDTIPEYSEVICKIIRGGMNVWQGEGVLGGRNMKFTQKQLVDILFQNDAFKLQPYSIHYVLLGASISTDKAGFTLCHGDHIVTEIVNDGLFLENIYEEEAIIYSCC
ncbi:hypothetical protein [Citrobacter koseri]|uniref:hypothetical protein n=1 Tax=Citrobacter koseri TaxID=545 RepID=UPI0028BE96E3|nr:hypothetical protein [Citrobacter koseri]MDT7459950.1 hypothetical protein [Citrobacter koseri]